MAKMTEVLRGPVTSCEGCGGRLDGIVDFLPQPPVQSFLSPARLREPETHFPLELLSCEACGLVQLGYVVDPETVFPPDYPYQTGLTRNLREDFKDLADKAVGSLGLQPGTLGVDIGSNDGTLLKGFLPHGLRVLGVEPTNIAEIARADGIPTIQAFFTEAVAAEIVREHGVAGIVAATNVLAHVPNLYPFLRGVSALLPDGGVFVSESHYLLELLRKLQYDTIYHEHLRFYGLRPLTAILSRAGFTVFDAEPVPTHGGSVRVWAEKGTSRASSERLREMTGAEEEYGLYSPARLAEFRERVVTAKHDLLETLIHLRKGGARIVGIGAPARSSMLLGYCHIDGDLVEYIVEPSGSLKIGLATPGSHIPILDEARMFEEQPDYALVLSWHIAEELMPKLRERGYRGGFIVPLPEPRVIPT